MQEIWVYLRAGFDHLAGLDGLDHMVYLLAISTSFSLLGWKKLIWLVTGFTLGHSISLMLSVVGWVAINPAIIENLIPITIIVSAVFFLVSGKNANWKSLILGTVLVGVVHGLGFSNFLNEIKSDSVFSSLLGFNLGLELAQLALLTVMVAAQIALLKFKVAGEVKLGKAINVLVIVLCLTLYII